MPGGNSFRIYPSGPGHLRKDGVVEYSGQGEINLADHMIEVFAGLEPQGVTGLVSIDNNLHTK